MSWKRGLFLGVILVVAIIGSSALIWHGLNLDSKENDPQVLGNSVLSVATQSGQLQTTPSAASINSSPIYVVNKVIDGDTFEIKIDNQTAKVRMIGIDTPETVDPRRAVGCFGKKASDETKRLLEGKSVTLVKDISDTDKYNRLLRYVFLPIGNGESLFVNDYLIRQGFAKTLTYPPDIKYNERFLAAEREARDNLRGLWRECK